MQMKKVLLKALVFLRDVLLVDLVIGLLVAISFLFTGKLTSESYSERIFWVGLGTTLIAAVVALGAMFSGRSFGIPAIIRRPTEAKRLLDNIEPWRAEVEKRNDLSIKLFFVGLGCIVISALVQTLLA